MYVCVYVGIYLSINLSISVHILTLNWWCGFITGTLANVEYLFIAITPRSTLTPIGIIC